MAKKKKNIAAGKKAKRKGNKWERDVAKHFSAWWGSGEWTRVPLSGGWAGRDEFSTHGDVITSAKDFPFVIECKNHEGWDLIQFLTSTSGLLNKWLQQTVDQTPEEMYPILVAKKNRRKSLIFFDSRAYGKYGKEKPRISPPHVNLSDGFFYKEKHYDIPLILMTFENFLKLNPEDFGKE